MDDIERERWTNLILFREKNSQLVFTTTTKMSSKGFELDTNSQLQKLSVNLTSSSVAVFKHRTGSRRVLGSQKRHDLFT